MSFEIVFNQRPAYLHAMATGANTKANVTGYLNEILRECTTRQVSRVLIEEQLDGPRLGMVDDFDLAADGSGRIAGIFEAIAYVDIYSVGGTMKFAETVAVNRGAPVRLFGSVAEAEQWLNSLWCSRTGARVGAF